MMCGAVTESYILMHRERQGVGTGGWICNGLVKPQSPSSVMHFLQHSHTYSNKHTPSNPSQILLLPYDEAFKQMILSGHDYSDHHKNIHFIIGTWLINAT